jgi:hypothetical protein
MHSTVRPARHACLQALAAVICNTLLNVQSNVVLCARHSMWFAASASSAVYHVLRFAPVAACWCSCGQFSSVHCTWPN